MVDLFVGWLLVLLVGWLLGYCCTGELDRLVLVCLSVEWSARASGRPQNFYSKGCKKNFNWDLAAKYTPRAAFRCVR